MFGNVALALELPVGILRPTPTAMFPDVNRSVGSTQARPLTEMSPRPRPTWSTRLALPPASGIGMPQDELMNGTPTFMEKRSVKLCDTLTSTMCCRLTT
jgi:hypothetical protein